MSIKVMNMVWDSRGLKGVSKLILLTLADFSNDNGVCWPSITTIANKGGVSKTTVKSHLNKLEADGYIRKIFRKKDNGDSDSNYYQISAKKLFSIIPKKKQHNPADDDFDVFSHIPDSPCAGGSGTDLGVGRNMTEGRAEYAPPRSGADLGVGQNTTEGRAGDDPKPSIEPSIEPPYNLKEISRSRKKVKSSFPDDFEITQDMRAWYSKQTGFSLGIDSATEQWSDAMIANGTQYLDWMAGWRTGMRNQNKWASERKGNFSQSSPKRNINELPKSGFGPNERYK